MGEKLTVEACETLAQDELETSGRCEPDHARHLLLRAEAFILAARALRAREWMRGRMAEVHSGGLAFEMLDGALGILDGREP